MDYRGHEQVPVLYIRCKEFYVTRKPNYKNFLAVAVFDSHHANSLFVLLGCLRCQDAVVVLVFSPAVYSKCIVVRRWYQTLR